MVCTADRKEFDMLYLDDRAAEVYADMHADLEAERVGHRVPVYQPSENGMVARFLRLQSFLRCQAGSFRYRLMEWFGRTARPQEQGC
jgi:hypothetical protein